jgi:Zn-dependent protease
MDFLRSGSFRLFRLAGITVFVHWMWFVVAFLEVQWRSDAYSSRGWNVLEYLSLFGIVLLHEFGHALACRSVGGTARHILLWPVGGIAYISPPARPGAVLWSIAAGPLVNCLFVPVLLGLILWRGLPLTAPLGIYAGVPLPAEAMDVDRYLCYVFALNLGLLALNLLPIFPLDGGQILWAVLWFFVGRWQSLQLVSFVGMFIGTMLLGTLVTPFWLIGLLAAIASFWSVSTYLQSRHMLHIQSLPRNPEADCPHCHAHPPTGPYWVCDHCGHRFDLFVCRGICPDCGGWFGETPCPACGRTSRVSAWLQTGGNALDSSGDSSRLPLPPSPDRGGETARDASG